MMVTCSDIVIILCMMKEDQGFLFNQEQWNMTTTEHNYNPINM